MAAGSGGPECDEMKLIRRRNLRLSLIDVRCDSPICCEALAAGLIGPTPDAEMNGRRADGNRRTPAAATAAPGGADDGQQSDTIGGVFLAKKRSMSDATRRGACRGPSAPSARRPPMRVVAPIKRRSFQTPTTA